MPTVQERAETLADRTFVGGPVDDFEEVGRLQLVTLLREGLLPSSRGLDEGCLQGGHAHPVRRRPSALDSSLA
jgi:hypothetical protein